jgi:hypothetical protein
MSVAGMGLRLGKAANWSYMPFVALFGETGYVSP